MNNELIAARREKAEIMGSAHALAADMYAKRHRLIAIPSIILSTILGTTTLSSFVEVGSAKLYVDVVICILAITVAVLTGLQTFLEYGVRAQKHSDAAAQLFALADKWELLFNRNFSDEKVTSLDDTYAKLIQRVPRASIHLQEEALKRNAEAQSAIPAPAKVAVGESQTGGSGSGEGGGGGGYVNIWKRGLFKLQSPR